MFNTLRRHTSFANVVSLLALFVALGGSAYAIGLKKNSVKSKHIVDGQVLSADVADDGLTGTDVQEATLDGVDAASLAGSPSSDFLQRGTRAGGDVGGTFSSLVLTAGAVGQEEIASNGVGRSDLRVTDDFTFDPPSLAPGACVVATDSPGPTLGIDDMTLAFQSGGSSSLDLRPARAGAGPGAAVQINVCNTADVAVNSGQFTIEYVVLQG